MSTEKPRYSITLDEELFKEVEDFRFEHRYQTRNQATVELIRLGLAEIKSGRNHPDFHSIPRLRRKFVFCQNKSLAEDFSSTKLFSVSSAFTPDTIADKHPVALYIREIPAL